MKTVLCFGDSNTHGTCPMTDLEDRRRFGPDTRWPGVMAEALGGSWQVVEEGLPGRTTVHDDPVEGEHKNGRRTLLAVLESHRPVDLLVLMLGTNDLKGRFGVGAVDIAGGLGRLATICRTSECGPGNSAPAILLMCPPPIQETGCLADMFAGGAAKSRQLGEHVQAVATSLDCAMLDAGDVIVSSELDGIHFEAEAHMALGGAVARKLTEMEEEGLTC